MVVGAGTRSPNFPEGFPIAFDRFADISFGFCQYRASGVAAGQIRHTGGPAVISAPDRAGLNDL
jgi:hypothetical protein